VERYEHILRVFQHGAMSRGRRIREEPHLRHAIGYGRSVHRWSTIDLHSHPVRGKQTVDEVFVDFHICSPPVSRNRRLHRNQNTPQQTIET
jgi:hypothetical protein